MKNRVPKRAQPLSILQDTQETVTRHFALGKTTKVQDRLLNIMQVMSTGSQTTEDRLKRFSELLNKILHQNIYKKVSEWQDEINILNIIEHRVPLADISSSLHEIIYHLNELNRITQKTFERTENFIEHLQNHEDFVAPLTEENDVDEDTYTKNAPSHKKITIEYRDQRITIPDDLPEGCPGWKTFKPNLPLCVKCHINIPCVEPEKG